jgi:hypothetical protein
MKNLFLVAFAIIGLFNTTSAQYTIALTEACASWTEVKVSGKITYPQSEFAVCAYTVELLDMNGNNPISIKVNEKTPNGGVFNFTGKIPAGKTIAFPCKIRVTTNRQTKATIDVNRYCGAVRFKNRYRADQYINVEKEPVQATTVGIAFLSAQWELIPIAGTNFYQIKSVWRPDQSLNIEKGSLESSAVSVAFWSGHWELETVVGAETFVRLKNRWKPDVYIHVENGKLEASAVSLSFQSANWLIEKTW